VYSQLPEQHLVCFAPLDKESGVAELTFNARYVAFIKF